MAWSVVHWEGMDLLTLETLVVIHVTLIYMNYLVVTLGPVRLMGAGVAVTLCVKEVSIYSFLHTTKSSYQDFIYICNCDWI